jgi:hypothetical protein
VDNVDQSNVVTGLLITNRGNRVWLACSEPDTGWAFPSEPVQAGETPPAAAARALGRLGLAFGVGELRTVDWADGEVFMLFDTQPGVAGRPDSIDGAGLVPFNGAWIAGTPGAPEGAALKTDNAPGSASPTGGSPRTARPP